MKNEQLGFSDGLNIQKNYLTKTFDKITVKKLVINNIKCFDNIELNFNNDFNLLLGGNARGKTTVLQLLAIGLCNLQYIPFPNSWFNVIRDKNAISGFELWVDYKNNLIDFKFEIDSFDNIKCIEPREKIHAIGDKIFVAGYGANRHIKYEERKQYFDIATVASLFNENSYLKNIKESTTYIYSLNYYDKIKQYINKVFEYAEETKSIEFADSLLTQKYDDYVTLFFKCLQANSPENEIPLEGLSDGYKTVFLWLFDMLLRMMERDVDIDHPENVCGIILLDEIELHLHPYWQRTIIPSLQMIFKNVQFIITSHSPLVAQSVDMNKIIMLEPNASDNTAKAKKTEEKTNDYQLTTK